MKKLLNSKHCYEKWNVITVINFQYMLTPGDYKLFTTGRMLESHTLETASASLFTLCSLFLVVCGQNINGQNANRTKWQLKVGTLSGPFLLLAFFPSQFLFGILSGSSKHVLAFCLKRIEHGVPISESMFYSFPSDRTKIDGVTLIRHTAIASRQILKRGSTSATRNSALNFKLKTPYPPLPNIFWTL